MGWFGGLGFEEWDCFDNKVAGAEEVAFSQLFYWVWREAYKPVQKQGLDIVNKVKKVFIILNKFKVTLI